MTTCIIRAMLTIPRDEAVDSLLDHSNGKRTKYRCGNRIHASKLEPVVQSTVILTSNR